MPLARGPVIVDLLGPELTAEDIDLLNHSQVGGVILFSRHYQSPKQITELCAAIRAARPEPLLISVDHEGGRVQRFREGFTVLPSMGQIGHTDTDEALQIAEASGWIMAAELQAVGIDFSFAPVLDLDEKQNPAIGNRAFHKKPEIVSQLAKSLVQGMRSAGMAATGKHFPGHGSVMVDSHLDLPRDLRTFDEIQERDLQPFKHLIEFGIDAIMPAHILFPNVDDHPVGFSQYWLQTILRQTLNFSGLIFSDDLNMQGADLNGGYAKRARAALNAGCDMVLICNNRTAAWEIVNDLAEENFFVSSEKFKTMQGKNLKNSLPALQSTNEWQEKNKLIINFTAQETS